MPSPLRGSEVEKAAIAWVMELERMAGRNPVRCVSPVDIESPPRLIEVKAVGKSSCRSEGLLMVELTQVEALRSNPNGYLYLVENVGQGDPAQFTLRIFHGDQLQRLLGRLRQRSYYELPVPVSEYDQARLAPGFDLALVAVEPAVKTRVACRVLRSPRTPARPARRGSGPTVNTHRRGVQAEPRSLSFGRVRSSRLLARILQ
jgi:hypothetical protein